MIPLHGALFYADIAAKMGVPQWPAHRILRLAVTSRIFRESRPGYVAEALRRFPGSEEPADSAIGLAFDFLPGSTNCRGRWCRPTAPRGHVDWVQGVARVAKLSEATFGVARMVEQGLHFAQSGGRATVMDDGIHEQLNRRG
jgi:hypothetical protein